MKWTIEAKGWIGFCPVWLANVDDAAPVIAPRWRLEWLLNAHFAVIDVVNFLIDCLFGVETGYCLHHVSDVEPFVMEFQ